MSIFKIDKNFEVILNPQAVKLIPELSGLTNQELMYVILVMDYVDSPLRKKPLDERKIIAARTVKKKKEDIIETPELKKAMNLYKSLVFDIRRETIDIYNQKIRMLQKESLGIDVSFSRMKEIDQSIDFMQNRVESMQHQLNIEESEIIEIKGGKKLSYLEIWQRRQKAYREFQKSN